MAFLSLQTPGGDIQPPGSIPDPDKVKLSDLTGNALTVMIVIAAVLSIVFMVLGGIAWITSGGDKTKIAAARAKLTYAIIGLVVTFLSFLIIKLIGYFFKVPLLG